MAQADFDIAVMCAHPDDAELFMGGTIVTQTRLGRKVALVDLTRGEAGSRGNPEVRAAEASEAARVLGVAHRETLGLPDARLEVTTAHKDPVVEAIRRLRPRVVLLQYWHQRHPDHATAGRIVYEAAFSAGLRHYRPELGTAFRPLKLAYSLAPSEAADVRPSFVVDITDVWDIKMRAVRAFASQFQPEEGETVALALDRFQASLELSARRHGHRIGVQYGEGFLTREPARIQDLLSLDVPSF